MCPVRRVRHCVGRWCWSSMMSRGFVGLSVGAGGDAVLTCAPRGNGPRRAATGTRGRRSRVPHGERPGSSGPNPMASTLPTNTQEPRRSRSARESCAWIPCHAATSSQSGQCCSPHDRTRRIIGANDVDPNRLNRRGHRSRATGRCSDVRRDGPELRPAPASVTSGR